MFGRTTDGVVGGQQDACRRFNATHTFVIMPYRAQNKFWHGGR